MAIVPVNDLEIVQGKTYQQVFRWEDKPIVRKPITGISFASGAPVLNVVGHGLTNGWRSAVFGVKGPAQLNATSNPPRKGDYRAATVVDTDHIEFNSVDPFDAAGKMWSEWVSGGFLQYFTAVNLTGMTARMSLKDKPGGTELFRFESSGVSPHGNILIDNTAKTITLVASDLLTAALAARKYVYDLEMISVAGVVSAISTGIVTVVREITTP